MADRARGFSLVELSLVLLLLALAAAAVGLRLSGPLRQVSMSEAVDRVVGLDRWVRQTARMQDRPLWLSVDPSSGRLVCTDAGGSRVGRAAELPEGFAVAELAVRGGGVGSGPAAVACSPRGLTASYAVRLSGPGGQARWLLFAGLSGQVTESEHDGEVRPLLQSP